MPANIRAVRTSSLLTSTLPLPPLLFLAMCAPVVRTLRRGSFVLPRLLFTQLPARPPAGSLSAWPASSSVALSCQVSPRLCSTRYRAGNIVAKTQGIVMPTVVSQRVSVTQQVQSAPFGGAAPAECAFPSHRARRMRFSVAPRPQNALFRRVRFSSPGQTSGRLTERRTLCRPPHGKAQSVPTTSRKSALCPTGGLQDALFRESAHLECAFW